MRTGLPTPASPMRGFVFVVCTALAAQFMAGMWIFDRVAQLPAFADKLATINNAFSVYGLATLVCVVGAVAATQD